MQRLMILFMCWAAVTVWSVKAWAYPLDGYPETGIRRLERIRLITEGKLKGTSIVRGARKPLGAITLNLAGPDGAQAIPPVDPELQREIDTLFPNRDESYSLCLLDITGGKPGRYAERQPDRLFSPGSVGKLAIAAGLFTELARLFPDSTEKRKALLKSRMVKGGRWVLKDYHEIPVFDPGAQAFKARPAQEGDEFSLYEWTDHMLSASANSAASVVWKEVMMMRTFGGAYPPAAEEEAAFFAKTPKKELRELAMAVVNEPLRRLGIAEADWQLGTFFTQAGKALIPGEKSYANTRALLAYLVALERGAVVDGWSSLEIKRMMYMTAKRIRYASAPALNKAAVYYKSGSLYRCKPEPGFVCGKYKGNVENTMNSVAIVEHPDGRVYLVALMSNVLRVNSAVEHQNLATSIDQIMVGAVKGKDTQTPQKP